MRESLQFFVTKLPDGRFKVAAQDADTILRSYEADEFQIMDALYKELGSLIPLSRDL